ncbi:transporter substrate-binding domain-containing protein [Longispora sp. NPDC051575]|uniref:transporter substrate-binding domain-containing protein n=1 Tax=Longispora sp. NPDC051575 TaxID=3154943 RepID=UPI0034224EAC
MRRMWAVLAVAAMFLSAACSTDPDPEEDPAKYLSGTVQIGANSDLPGWSDYVNGVWSGFDISLANWLGHKVGFTPQFLPMTTNERMIKLREASVPGVTAPPIKLVISNFSMTDDRRKEIDFAGPYFSTYQGLLTLSSRPVNELREIEGREVCVTAGSTNQDRIGGFKVLPLPQSTLKQCMDALYAGSVVAVTSDVGVLNGFAARDPKRLRVSPVQVGTERYGIGMPNNRPRLCAFLKAKLTEFVDEAWDQKFKDSLPGIAPQASKPNSQALDPCEQPRPVAQGPAPSATTRAATLTTSARRRRR